MTSLRNRLFPAVAAAFAIGAIAVASCTSDNKTSVDTESTTTTVVGDATTTVAGASTTAAVTTAPATTAHATTVKATTPPTNPPPTNPPPTTPPVFTSFSVSPAGPCPVEGVSSVPPPATVTVSWSATGADSVNLNIDGGLWGSYGLTGSEQLPAACNGGHNVHTYSAVAIKNGQTIATKSATRGS